LFPLFSTAVFTSAAVFFLRNVKTLIAYTPATDWAEVEMQMGFQIRSVKGGAVFVSPQHIQRVLVFYDGAALACKRLWGACPFFSAFVAEETE
jgi:hypothetical protein